MMNNNEFREHDDLCVGIDLGTTNSVIATINVKPNGELVSKVVNVPRPTDTCDSIGDKVTLNSRKESTLPSCVYYREENEYKPLVGGYAKRQYSLRPHMVAKSVKSQMGKPFVEGLADDIPDKTPAEVSARILSHLLGETAKIYRKKQITDAVITVPANFDSAMCKATLDAAKLAGICVNNEDGSARRILLSEPNAVIYDFVNQSQNGEISGSIIDFDTKKNVMVFDLGGGTLDITMHEIERRGLGNGVLKIKDLATNRYTLLGGDDFDEKIAEAMYQRYLKQYENAPAAVCNSIEKRKKDVMAQLRVYAENLKLELNERCDNSYCSGWDDEDDDIVLDVGGNMGGIPYAYSDEFTKEEIEEILSPFMAEQLNFSDFKKLAEIKDTRNIIYPILDVLDKTLQKLRQTDPSADNVKVDAVIVNGGMTKFYMIQDRLESFFGFKPIVVLDPDLAVARGAAVYHYYLHKYNILQDDMRMVDIAEASDSELQAPMAIQLGNSILNDSLYLGAKNNAVHPIIPTGAELPYCSEVMTGFSIEPGQNMISVPIKSRNLDGTYRTIACGHISFHQKYMQGAYLAFRVFMGSNKVITMNAWTSKDPEGMQKLEQGSVEITIGQSDSGKKSKLSAPSGSALIPADELHNLLSLCRNYDKTRDKGNKRELYNRIGQRVKLICDAGNKEAFAEPVLEELASEVSDVARQRLFVIARELGSAWNQEQLRKLASCCLMQLSGELNGLQAVGPKVFTNTEALKTLDICGSKEQLNRVEMLHTNVRYSQVFEK